MKYKKLKDFGKTFLGPIILSYFSDLETKLQSNNVNYLLFLSREGFFLHKWFLLLREKGFFQDITSKYLLVSRAALYRLCLMSEETYEIPLRKGFHQRKVLNFLTSRMGLSELECAELKYSSMSKDITFSLPDDKEEILELFSENSEVFRRIISESYFEYKSYLEELGVLASEQKIGIVDIGFSGTIQECLETIFGIDTIGFYFATVFDEKRKLASQKVKGAFVENGNFGEGVNLIDKSLFIESILTAPYGQFKCFRNVSGERMPIHSHETVSQDYFYILQVIADGIEEYITNRTVLKALKKGYFKETINEVTKYYQILTTDEVFMSDEIFDFFEIDDEINGIGNIKPIEFLKN